MSAKLNLASGSDLYATVDLSKKKKNAPHQEESMDSSMYAVVNKKCKGSNTIQATYGKENDNITTQSKRNNENDLDIEGKKIKKRLNTALVLSLVANAAVSIIVVLLVVIFVRTNEKVSYDMAALNSSIEKQLKVLDDNIQHLNATAVRSSSSFLLQVTNFSNLVEEESSKFLLQAISHSENISQQYLQLLTTISRLYSSSARAELLINSNITSCAALKDLNASSGYYTLPSSTGVLTRVYCDMDMTCGNITGGWMRVADLDLYNCPPGLRSQTVQGNITCIKNEYGKGCTPVLYNTFGISYSKVCGEITGYGMKTLDGFFGRSNIQKDNLDDNYLDGISIQSGASHVWSFVAGRCAADCNNKPSFIGDDWICDGRCVKHNCTGPLWDTLMCGRGNPFLKTLSAPSKADIELRVCRDENRDNEDIAITDLRIYVQ